MINRINIFIGKAARLSILVGQNSECTCWINE